jgi:hypothetical protein
MPTYKIKLCFQLPKQPKKRQKKTRALPRVKTALMNQVTKILRLIAVALLSAALTPLCLHDVIGGSTWITADDPRPAGVVDARVL